MSINPLDMLKDLGSLKEKLAQANKELQSVTEVGQSGGGLVKVTLNGRFECLSIELDPIAVDSRDVVMLQTLIKSAHHDAFNKVSQKMKEKAMESGLGSQLSSLISSLG